MGGGGKERKDMHEEEMEGGTCTSSKGQSYGSQPNDQTMESSLNRLNKKCKKMPIVKRASTSTKTWVVEANVKATKHNLGKLK